MNKMAKGEGGVIGLRENAAGFEKWMTAGPEMARLVDEFKQALQPTNNNDQRHHEQTAAHQKRYKQDLSSLKRKLSDLGNPFAEESDELPCLQKRLQNKSTKSTKDLKVKTANTNCGLFARLYVGCQARGGDLDEF
ncbi:hypothetical protein ACOMHN_065807 [Nucella lapillus]